MTNYWAEEQFLLADDLIKDNQLEQAVDTLHNILVEDPSFGKAHNHLGWIYETKYKNYKKAEEHYKLALKISPEYTATYINYVYFLSTVNRPDELEAHLNICEQVVGINRATLANEWAIFYETKQMYDEAIIKYKDFIALSFSNDEIERGSASITRCKKKKEIFNS